MALITPRELFLANKMLVAMETNTVAMVTFVVAMETNLFTTVTNTVA